MFTSRHLPDRKPSSKSNSIDSIKDFATFRHAVGRVVGRSIDSAEDETSVSARKSLASATRFIGNVFVDLAEISMEVTTHRNQKFANKHPKRRS